MPGSKLHTPVLPRHLRARLARFARRYDSGFYAGFTPDTLAEYLDWHAGQRTLFYTHRFGRLRSLATAWQCHADELESAAEAGACPFRWAPTNPAADALCIANVVALEPAALAGVMALMRARWPAWRSLALYTWRHGRLHCLSSRHLDRLFRFSLRPMSFLSPCL